MSTIIEFLPLIVAIIVVVMVFRPWDLH